MLKFDWIEVAYISLSQEQALIRLDYKTMTVEQAIERSGILQQFPEIELSKNKVGLFSHRVRLSQPLKAGDRVEIYRELVLNPKQARRQRASSSTS